MEGDPFYLKFWDKLTVLKRNRRFLDSRSRSLYVIVSPSVVCLSPVTFVHPTQAIEIFVNVSIRRVVPWPSMTFV